MGEWSPATILLDSSRSENSAEVQPWSISLPNFRFLKVYVFPLRIPPDGSPPRSGPAMETDPRAAPSPGAPVGSLTSRAPLQAVPRLLACLPRRCRADGWRRGHIFLPEQRENESHQVLPTPSYQVPHPSPTALLTEHRASLSPALGPARERERRQDEHFAPFASSALSLSRDPSALLGGPRCASRPEP